MPIELPAFKGATTYKVIAHHETLCKEIINTIQKHARYNKDREVNDEINRRIRAANDALGMKGSRKMGCLYHEAGFEHKKSGGICEHAIPLTKLVELYRTEKKTFLELSLYPIARISKELDANLTRNGLARNGHDLKHPFKRYQNINPPPKIKTHKGDAVDLENWSITDHWNLVFETEELKNLLEDSAFKNPAALNALSPTSPQHNGTSPNRSDK